MKQIFYLTILLCVSFFLSACSHRHASPASDCGISSCPMKHEHSRCGCSDCKKHAEGKDCNKLECPHMKAECEKSQKEGNKHDGSCSCKHTDKHACSEGAAEAGSI